MEVTCVQCSHCPKGNIWIKLIAISVDVYSLHSGAEDVDVPCGRQGKTSVLNGSVTVDRSPSTHRHFAQAVCELDCTCEAVRAKVQRFKGSFSRDRYTLHALLLAHAQHSKQYSYIGSTSRGHPHDIPPLCSFTQL